MGCGTKDSVSCCPLDRDHPQFLDKWAFSTQPPTSSKTGRERESSSKTDVTIVCNIITEMTSFHHLCHIYWLDARHSAPPPCSRGGCHIRCEYQEVGIMGSASESICPRMVKILKVTQGLLSWCLQRPHLTLCCAITADSTL